MINECATKKTRIATAMALICLPLCTLTLEACKDKEARDPDSQYACERDLDRINDQRPCSQNEDCPCGTHCLSGLCAYECLEDADCEGWCDYFGRCR